MNRRVWASVPGPLRAVIPGFAVELRRMGYAERSVGDRLALAGHLNAWLAECGLQAGDLTEGTVERFFAVRRAAGFTAFRTPKTLAVLLDYLRGLGVAPPAEAAPCRTPAELLLDRYRSYLLSVIDEPLATAVPRAAAHPQGLPRYLEPGQVQALLASCALETPAGLRDHTIMILLSRLGLRAGEVAALRLDDIDWRRGEIVVRGKGNSCDRLPLPVDVGQALADYLESARPREALDRCVFVHVRAPRRGLTARGVSHRVAAASRRAGLEQIFAHRMRHSAATAMLRAGSQLEEVGQVLRHRQMMTTANYARVDVEGLRALARPWLACAS